MGASLAEIIDRVAQRLAAHPDVFEVTYRKKPPVSGAALDAIERKLNAKLPAPLRELYTRHSGGLALAWRARRGQEERLDGDVQDPPEGMLVLEPPSQLGRRLASDGVLQITNDGAGNGYALRIAGARVTMVFFEHDRAAGERVKPTGTPRLDRWLAEWATHGFGDMGRDRPALERFFRTGKLAPSVEEAPPQKKKAARAKPGAPAPFVEAPKHKEQVWSVVALPDGVRGASGGNDGSIHLFDLSTGKRTAKLLAAGAVYALVAHDDGKRLIAGGTRGFEVFDTKSGKPTRASQPSAGPVLDMDLAPDGRTLVTIGRGTLAAWDLTTGKPIASVEDGGSSVRVDSRGQAVTLDDRTLRVWDLRTKRRVREITHPKMPRGFLSRSLALDLRSDTIYLLDPAPVLAAVRTDGKWLRAPRSGENARPYLALTPDGTTVLQPGPEVGVTLCAWDVATGEVRWSASLSDRPGVSAVALTRDGRRAIFADGPGFVSICDLEHV